MFLSRKGNTNKGGKGGEGKTIQNTHFFLDFPTDASQRGADKAWILEELRIFIYVFIYNHRSTLPHQSLESMDPKEQEFCPGRQHFDHILSCGIFLNLWNSNCMCILRFQNEILHFPSLEWYQQQWKFNLKKFIVKIETQQLKFPEFYWWEEEKDWEGTHCWFLFFFPSLSANAIKETFFEISKTLTR